MTFPFSLQIKDYNTFIPLSNKQIQITNIDSKQTYTQTTDSRGYVSFRIKESERGDFFSVKLINDNEYEQTPYYLTKQSPHTKLTSSHHTNNTLTSSQTTNPTQSTNNNTQQHIPNQYNNNQSTHKPSTHNPTLESHHTTIQPYSNQSNIPYNHNNQQSPNNNTQTHTSSQTNSHLSNQNHISQQSNPQTQQPPKHTTQKILNPNSYANHTALLYFKAQISLYFNGTTLCIMQGTKNLASFNARSGKALTQEEKLELEQQGYEGFVSSFTDDELLQTLQHSKAKDPAITQKSTLQASCYHCYDKRYQERGQCIQDGVYYLNTSQVEYLKQSIQELESQNAKVYRDHSQENQISKEEKESDTQEPHTTQYNDMQLTLYKDRECKEECAMIRVYQARSADSSNLSMIQMQYDKLKEFLQKQMSLHYPASQPYTILQVEMANSITSIRILNHNVSVFANIAKPFAPGTYIKLEAVGENIENSIYWQVQIQAWRGDKMPQKPYIASLYESKQPEEHSKGIYISDPNTIDDLRQQGYDRFIYIIRASTAQSFVNAAQLVFNLSFEVGVGSDMEVREGEYKSNDTTFAIATLSQAIEYLRMTYVHYKEQKNAGQIHSLAQYFSKYPRTAGKIAYIYYRFDIADEGFIKSVEGDNGAYSKDREGYIEDSKNMLLYGYLDSKKSIKIIDEYKRLISKKDVKLNKDFIEKLIKKVCEEFKLSLQAVCDENQQCSIIGFYEKNSESYGYYNVDSNTIHINETNLWNLKEIIATVFHEMRHCYINTYFNPHKYADLSVLKQYLYQSDQLYIESAVVKGTNIFKKFTKRCLNNDADNVDCIPDDNQNAYEIQPNERDPRYVAYQIIKVL